MLRRALLVSIGVAMFAACGETLDDDAVDAPDRKLDAGGDAATGDDGAAKDGSDAEEPEEDAAADVDAGCVPRTRCADDASVCTFEHACAPLLAVGEGCDASYQCANKRCDPDSGKCTGSTDFYSCVAQDEGCFGVAGCCAGTYCADKFGTKLCEPCALPGQGCFFGGACCSGKCNVVCE